MTENKVSPNADLPSSPETESPDGEDFDTSAAEYQEFRKNLTERVPEKGRSYQMTLCELAKEENCIICLPTGCGKTYIALSVAKSEYLPKAIEQNKKIIFLANSIPLVFQQAEYFKRHISSSDFGEKSYVGKKHVKAITGAMGTDYWDKKKWKEIMDKTDVLVMIPEILKIAISHKRVTFDQINLLIFDECHHATKSHPMAVIMKDYTDKKEMFPNYELPRVIGLTATIIMGTSKIDQIAKEVESIEARLDSRAVTYPNYEEVQLYSTSANISVVQYMGIPRGTDALKSMERTILNLLEDSCINIKQKAKTLKDSRVSTVEIIDHPDLNSTSQMYNKNKMSAGDITRALVDVKKIFENEDKGTAVMGLGLYAGRLAARQKRAFLQMMVIDDQSLENLRQQAEETLTRVVDYCDSILIDMDKAKQIEVFVSAKVDKLYNMLLEWKKTIGRKETLCAIVFCTERFTAQILSWLFVDASKYISKFGFIKPFFVVGSAGANNDLEEQKINAMKLEETIHKFREKELNLVFATNVLEEGLDVPACNFIIRFDPIVTYPSFVQSMGRGRKSGAVFSAMTTAKDVEKTKSKIRNYQAYGLALSRYLLKDERHIINADEDDKEDGDDSKFLINPDDPNSPKITLTGSVQLIYHYCHLLSTDRIVSLEPTSWWKKVGVVGDKIMYTAWVALPINSPVRDVIQGKMVKDKNVAKRYAFLETCKRLYLAGALDEDLFPLRRTIPNHIREFLDAMNGGQENRNGKKIGTRNNVMWYEKKVAESITNSKIDAGDNFKAYWIRLVVLKSTTDSPERENLYYFEKAGLAFAILTKINLDELPPICLFGRYGILTCSFVNVKLKQSLTLTVDQVSRIANFQKFIFSECLNINHPIMSLTNEHNFLISGITQDANKEWDINWNLMNKASTITKAIYSAPKTEEERRHIHYSREELENAVVAPWYRPGEIQLYCVCSIRDDLKTSSPMDGKANSKSFDQHYFDRYGVKILNKNQSLVRCAAMGSQLNFLNRKRNDDVMTKAEKKMNHDASGLVDLIPEFVNIFPLPASLLIQAQFLPSIIHRIHRLMLSREIQFDVAQKFKWPVAMDWKNFQVEDQSSVLEFCDRPIPSPVKKRKVDVEQDKNSTDHSTEPISQPSNSSTEKRKRSKTEDIIHLDYIHPDEITDNEIEKHRSWKVNRVQNKNLDSKSAFLAKLENPTNYILPLVPLKEILFESLDAPTNFKKAAGPSPLVIMEALTLSNANDVLSLESLEVIGDSFLKFCVSTHIFCEFPLFHEGDMTEMRNKLVSNAHLFYVGSQKNIGDYLSGGIFVPHCSWLPPGQKLPSVAGKAAAKCDATYDVFTLDKDEIEKMSVDQLVSGINKNGTEKEPSEKQKKSGGNDNSTFTHTRLGDKSIADSVEALIGAYYMNGGQDAALAFMEWIGLGPTDIDGKFTLYRRRQAPKCDNSFNYKAKKPEDFLPYLSELETLIGYKFKNKWLVVEAFSHAAYLRNTVTGCYQRLEFIGDAVLDFLVTNHIYKNRLRKTPGELTDLRSALVNNVTFGSLSVRYKLHTHLLLMSKKLDDAIIRFETYQEKNGHAVTGHFTLMNDLETPKAMEIEVPKLLGDIFESLAGAVFLDSNMSLDVTWKVFYRLMKNDIDEFTRNTPLSPIRELYEKFPNLKFKVMEDVSDLKSEKSERKVETNVSVKLNGKMYYGTGTNKKQAKQAVAKYALMCTKMAEQRSG